MGLVKVRYGQPAKLSTSRDLVIKTLDKIEREIYINRLSGIKQSYISVDGNTKAEVDYFLSTLKGYGYAVEYKMIVEYNKTGHYIMVRY